MLAIIGGTGLYDLDSFKLVEEISVDNFFGKPSAVIKKLSANGKEFFFLPRHGNNHNLLPSEINYRANIFALKKLNVTQVISISAVGSLQEELKPGDLVLVDQYFDFIKGNREKSFFGNGMLAHISTANSSCEILTDFIYQKSKDLAIDVHSSKTYACVDGPRLGTKAESLFLKNCAKADILGMTNIPEVFLANEAQISYLTIGVVTDYDCWREGEGSTVTEIITRYQNSIKYIKDLLKNIFDGDLPIENENRKKLTHAILSNKDTLNQEQQQIIDILLR